MPRDKNKTIEFYLKIHVVEKLFTIYLCGTKLFNKIMRNENNKL